MIKVGNLFNSNENKKDELLEEILRDIKQDIDKILKEDDKIKIDKVSERKTKDEDIDEELLMHV